MDRLATRSGTSLLVFGAGPAGLILVALGRLAGLTPIIVAEPDADRRDSAMTFGADGVVDPSVEGWQENALRIVGGTGYDSIVEAVGSAKVLQDAIPLAARQGMILVFGVANPADTATIRPQEVFVKELTILGTVINPYTHHRAVELLPRLGLERLGFRTFALEAHADAFLAQQRRAAGKVQFAPQGS